MATDRSSKVLGFSVPVSVAKEVERIAKKERRTRSELFREMVRVYSRHRIQRERDDKDRWIDQLIEETQAEERANPTTVEELLNESRRLARYGERQMKKLGIKPGDIQRIVDEHRAEEISSEAAPSY